MYKTAMCPRLDRRSTCIYGDACIFAHDPTEMRKPPPHHTKYKTTRCNKFQLGYCPYGTRCQFIHDEADVAFAAPELEPETRTEIRTKTETSKSAKRRARDARRRSARKRGRSHALEAVKSWSAVEDAPSPGSDEAELHARVMRLLEALLRDE